ncbi:hypothetical protein DFH11DRAFT_1569390 [Phellopilus nigrolimitatus]|nr:hypothetical protein DFH11DRAFT_1569390 [Phellopilus nigrolimitatus]
MSSLSHLSRSWSSLEIITSVLKAGAIISGADATDSKIANPNGLSDVLHARLALFDEIIDGVSRHRPLDLPSLKLDTAFASLYVLERVQAIIGENERSGGSVSPAQKDTAPLIGSRDMAQLRTHLSLVYNWGTELLLSRILPTLPNKRSSKLPPGAQIIDLTAAFEDYTLLFGMLNRLLAILFPDGAQGRTSQTFVAATILNRGFSDLLRPCICLGWLPSDLRGDLPPTPDLISYTMRLLSCVPPSQTIASLGQILSKPAQVPTYVGKICSQLLSGQLLRPAGVAGLFSATFGEDTASTDAPLVKLETVSRVLNLVPSKQTREVYYPRVITRLLHLLTPAMEQKTPPAHKRAAAFALSRMLTTAPKDGTADRDIRRRIVAWCLLDSFHPSSTSSDPDQEAGDLGLTEEEAKARVLAKEGLVVSPSDAVPTLSTILTNTDPSPDLITALLQPIIPQLFSLLEHLRVSKTADPTMRETVEGLLSTWARAASKEEVVAALWKVVEGEGYDWRVDAAGELFVTERTSSLPSLTLAQLADLQEGKLDNDGDEESNPLNLRPHPLHFAKFLKSINREDISSALYLRVLDAHVKFDNEDDPMRKLLLFQLIMQISAQAGGSASAESPLKRPDVSHMLMFIKLSLEQDSSLVDAGSSGKLTLDSLRLVPEDDKEDDDGGDSDDEDLAPGLEGVNKSEHLSVTAVNLLLTLLEDHPDLSPKTIPLLNDIYLQLEPLANSASDALRPRAREARLTLTCSGSHPHGTERGQKGAKKARRRSTSARSSCCRIHSCPCAGTGCSSFASSSRRRRRPPGRARRRRRNLRTTRAAAVSIVQGAQVAAPAVASALVPAILSIFMQSIQDEDSYIFLNAVQGLAAMVDGFGKEVLRALVDEYARGVGGVGGSAMTMSSREVDMRVRIGEALGQVIRRCGKALGSYVDIVIPPIFAVVRASHLPTTLRTSAVSLLATAADTNSLALHTYTSDLVSAMIDLVQVESVSAAKSSAKTRPGLNSPKSTPPGAQNAAGDVKGKKEGSTTPAREETSDLQTKTPTGQWADQHGDDGSNVIESITMDAAPTAADPKFPPLRRAALHFLSLLLRSLTARVYEDGGEGFAFGSDVSVSSMKRGTTVLGYISVTDEDDVVRVMAREAAEQVDQLRRAAAGL